MFGELIKTAVVFSFNCASNAAKLIWKVSISAGIMVSFKPAPAVYGLYSEKQGANVMISSPGFVTARKA